MVGKISLNLIPCGERDLFKYGMTAGFKAVAIKKNSVNDNLITRF